MIKPAPMFVLGVQESVFVDFVSQNKVKILHEVKTCQDFFYQKFPYKNEQIYVFEKNINLFRSKIFCAVLFDFKLLK